MVADESADYNTHSQVRASWIPFTLLWLASRLCTPEACLDAMLCSAVGSPCLSWPPFDQTSYKNLNFGSPQSTSLQSTSLQSTSPDRFSITSCLCLCRTSSHAYSRPRLKNDVGLTHYFQAVHANLRCRPSHCFSVVSTIQTYSDLKYKLSFERAVMTDNNSVINATSNFLDYLDRDRVLADEHVLYEDPDDIFVGEEFWLVLRGAHESAGVIKSLASRNVSLTIPPCVEVHRKVLNGKVRDRNAPAPYKTITRPLKLKYTVIKIAKADQANFNSYYTKNMDRYFSLPYEGGLRIERYSKSEKQADYGSWLKDQTTIEFAVMSSVDRRMTSVSSVKKIAERCGYHDISQVRIGMDPNGRYDGSVFFVAAASDKNGFVTKFSLNYCLAESPEFCTCFFFSHGINPPMPASLTKIQVAAVKKTVKQNIDPNDASKTRNITIADVVFENNESNTLDFRVIEVRKVQNDSHSFSRGDLRDEVRTIGRELTVLSEDLQCTNCSGSGHEWYDCRKRKSKCPLCSLLGCQGGRKCSANARSLKMDRMGANFKNGGGSNVCSFHFKFFPFVLFPTHAIAVNETAARDHEKSTSLNRQRKCFLKNFFHQFLHCRPQLGSMQTGRNLARLTSHKILLLLLLPYQSQRLRLTTLPTSNTIRLSNTSSNPVLPQGLEENRNLKISPMPLKKIRRFILTDVKLIPNREVQNRILNGLIKNVFLTSKLFLYYRLVFTSFYALISLFINHNYDFLFLNYFVDFFRTAIKAGICFENDDIQLTAPSLVQLCVCMVVVLLKSWLILRSLLFTKLRTFLRSLLLFASWTYLRTLFFTKLCTFLRTLVSTRPLTVMTKRSIIARNTSKRVAQRKWIRLRCIYMDRKFSISCPRGASSLVTNLIVRKKFGLCKEHELFVFSSKGERMLTFNETGNYYIRNENKFGAIRKRLGYVNASCFTNDKRVAIAAGFHNYDFIACSELNLRVSQLPIFTSALNCKGGYMDDVTVDKTSGYGTGVASRSKKSIDQIPIMHRTPGIDASQFEIVPAVLNLSNDVKCAVLNVYRSPSMVRECDIDVFYSIVDSYLKQLSECGRFNAIGYFGDPNTSGLSSSSEYAMNVEASLMERYDLSNLIGDSITKLPRHDGERPSQPDKMFFWFDPSHVIVKAEVLGKMHSKMDHRPISVEFDLDGVPPMKRRFKNIERLKKAVTDLDIAESEIEQKEKI